MISYILIINNILSERQMFVMEPRFFLREDFYCVKLKWIKQIFLKDIMGTIKYIIYHTIRMKFTF